MNSCFDAHTATCISQIKCQGTILSTASEANKRMCTSYIEEKTRIPRKAASHLLGQKSQEPQSECHY